jgi:trehalose utilization protein
MDRGIKRTDKIKVAVVVGSHPYDVPGFRGLFDRLPGIDYYIQELDTWSVPKWSGNVWEQYDVHLFYNMHLYNSGFASVRDDMDERIAETVGRLGESEHGVVVLHHALLNFVEMGPVQEWDGICNTVDRHLQGFYPGVKYRAHIVDPQHPITRGLTDWDHLDETFVISEPGAESQLLVTTDCPQSTKALGWAHDYKKARVFCFQCGHSNPAWVDPNFQTILYRGIQWAARKI